ncbi:MAG: phospholipase [Ignavibacteria bacterium]|nr:phospholipase [Ignavibacteria bacterium]
MNEKHIIINRSMRYYTMSPGKEIRDIWILLHGYGQLASQFISKFRIMAENGSLLIAPEGLMRFYLHGSYGEVGASWMTKEDRENDIKDYVNYLDSLYDKEIRGLKNNSDIKINSLGFSQGVATLSRWISFGNAALDRSVFWCGELAHDVDYTNDKFKHAELVQVFGSDDKIFPDNFINVQRQLLESAGLKPYVYVFKGGHEINTELMREAGLI